MLGVWFPLFGLHWVVILIFKKKKNWAISILLEFIEIIVCENYVHLSNKTKLRNGSLGTVP